MTTKRSGVPAFATLYLLAAAVMSAPVTTIAQQASEARTYTFRIEASPMSRALAAYSEVSGVQLVYDSEFVKDIRSSSLTGSYSAQEALNRLLEGSGLQARFTSSTTATVVRVEANGARTLGPVRVEGVTTAARVNGSNGSRDVTATEATDSFTSGALAIGSKEPRAMKDVPQSLSVITARRMEEQNLIDFTNALAQAPGITLVKGNSSLENTFYSRGFPISSIQVDGGAPLYNGYGFYPEIDLAQYDHVEVLRGPSAYFNGYGEPSGTVNLVRKKPLDHRQLAVEAQAGSWKSYRFVVDSTGPLAFDGQLRGRAVVSYQDNEHFYDVASDNRTLVYGIVEYDVTPSVLASAGISNSRQDSVPWMNGLPRYQNGDDLHLPRRTAVVFPWNRWDFDTVEMFGAIEQKVGGDWSLRLNLTHNSQESTRKLGYSNGAVNPLTGAGAVMTARFDDYASKQLSAEATLFGAFEMLGQRQEMVAGVNHADTDGAGQIGYPSLIAGSAALPYQPYVGGPVYCNGSTPPCPADSIRMSGPPIDFFAFNPRDPRYAEPRNALPTQRYRENGVIQSGAYLNLKLTAFDRLHLAPGLRYSRFKYNQVFDSLCTSIPTSGTPSDFNCVGRQVGDPFAPSAQIWSDEDFTWPPALSLSYDLTDNMTAHVGYTDIYLSQASRLDGDADPVDPITGSNIEAGLKWQARGGRLNVALAAYRIEQTGFTLLDQGRIVEDSDGSLYVVDNRGNRYFEGTVDQYHTCCYLTDLDITKLSQGIDAELSGELLPGWQLSAAYTYGENEYRGGDLPLLYGDVEGQSFVTLQPRHLLKLWSSYRLPGEGWSRGLTVSGGVSAQSKAFRSGTACVQLNPPNAQGLSTCAPGQTVPYSFAQQSYALLSARIDYQLSAHWAIAANFDNVTDKRYYRTMGSSTSGNWYGEPFGYALTLRARW